MQKWPGKIALTRLRGMGPLPDVLQARAGERHFVAGLQSVGLPLEALKNPDIPIPVSLMCDFFAYCAAVLDDRTLGLHVGKMMTHQGWGKWTSFCAQAETLEEALRRICATTWAHMSEFQVTLEPQADYWIWRVVPPVRPNNVTHYIDHLIFPMMTFVSLYLGTSWRPDWISVNYPREGETEAVETLLQASLRHNDSGIAIPLSRRELACRRHASAPSAPSGLELSEITSDLMLSRAPEPARSFSAIVALRLLNGESDVDGAATMVGLSLQGLQRRLRTSGYTYKEILETTRRGRAMMLLEQTQLPIAEIAISLGYEEHANFSRAFHRWMGCSPTAYRANCSIDARLALKVARD